MGLVLRLTPRKGEGGSYVAGAGSGLAPDAVRGQASEGRVKCLNNLSQTSWGPSTAGTAVC